MMSDDEYEPRTAMSLKHFDWRFGLHLFAFTNRFSMHIAVARLKTDSARPAPSAARLATRKKQKTMRENNIHPNKNLLIRPVMMSETHYSNLTQTEATNRYVHTY